MDCATPIAVTSQVTASKTPSVPTGELARARNAVVQILNQSGLAFKEGAAAYLVDNDKFAGERFDHAIELFLRSTFHIQRSPELSRCYNTLVETIYRLEFPFKTQDPRLRELSAACMWKLDDALIGRLTLKVTSKARQQYVLSDTQAELIVKRQEEITESSLEFEKAKFFLSEVGAQVQAGTESNSALVRAEANYRKTLERYVKALDASSADSTIVDAKDPSSLGFTKQVFEPSTRDELGTFHLSDEVPPVEFQTVPYQIGNKSLGFSFQVHPIIQESIATYRAKRMVEMETGLYRSGMFMRMSRRIFKEEGIPENLAWLGQIASGWKPNGVTGLWRLGQKDASAYGLNRTALVDEVKSLDEATRAAARRLKFLFNRYGNWELAIAGYFSEANIVDDAIKKAGVANLWVAYPFLKSDQRRYVPDVLATILIANNPSEYGFGHVRPAAQLQYDRIRVPSSTKLSVVANAADTTIEYLRYLNPHLRTNITPPEAYVINIPHGTANEVVALFRRIPAPAINNTNVATSPAGETWENISNRTGVSVADLKSANPGMKVPKGRVFVPVRGNDIRATDDSRPASVADPGPKPRQAKDGKIKAVIDYFNATLDDPYSMTFDSWSPVSQLIAGDFVYWVVTVRYRAKNTFAAYVLSETTFYIRHNKVVSTSPSNGVVITTSSRPTNIPISSMGGVRYVRALPGDTVAKIAAREKVNAIELAKFNGLLVNSLLGAGREIKIPAK